MMRIFKQNVIAALLAAIVFLVTLPFVDSVMRWYYWTQPAITWHGAAVKTPVVRPGENLEIVYHAVIQKQCPADIRGFIIAPDGNALVRLPAISGGYTKPTDGRVTEIPVTIRIPSFSDAGLPQYKSGEYIYRTLVTRYCASGVEDDNNVPDVRFFMEVAP